MEIILTCFHIYEQSSEVERTGEALDSAMSSNDKKEEEKDSDTRFRIPRIPSCYICVLSSSSTNSMGPLQ